MGDLEEPLVSGAGDMSKAEALEESGVVEYKGFMEQTYRLVFAFEDHFPETVAQQHLQTILPHGKVENDKWLKAEKEKGLIAYGFAQNMEQETLDKQITAGVLNESHRDCPFIWSRPDGSNALVQTWTTAYNEKWKKTFRLFEKNPTETKFDPQAVDEFHKSMIRLFGERARDHPPQFAISAQQNEKSVFIGTGKQLIHFLTLSSEVRQELNVHSIKEDTFTSNLVNGKGETGSKPFSVEHDKVSALYTKKGWEVMACTKPIEQFVAEAVLKEDTDDKIPGVLLATPVPDWAYDGEVAKLFLNDPSVVVGTPEIPRPIPMDACVGPAVIWARRRTAALWTQVFLSTAFSYVYMAHYGVTSYPKIIWVSFVLTVVYGMYAEFECLKHFVVPWVQQVHGCVTPLLGKQPFHVWFSLMASATTVGMLSVQTNAIFMLTTVFFEDTHDRETELWTFLMKKSMFSHLHINWEATRPASFVVFFWLISTLQLWWPLMHTWPVKGEEDIDYRVRFDKTKGKPTWKTLAGTDSTHYEALVEYAFSGGMAAVGCGVFTYPLGKMTDDIKQKRQHWEWKAMKNLEIAQKAAFQRLTLDAFLKKTLQLKVQVTLYALHRGMTTNTHARNGFADVMWMNLLPIIVTLMTGLAFQVDLTLMCIKRQFEVNLAVRYRLKHLDKESNALYETLMRNSLFITIVFVLCFLGISYSILQILCLHYCETSLWNISGCVTQEELQAFQDQPN